MLAAHCMVSNSPLRLLLVRLYEHNPCCQPCHTIGSQLSFMYDSQNTLKTDTCMN